MTLDSTSSPTLRPALEPLFLGENNAYVRDIIDNNPVLEKRKAGATKLRETIARIHAERGPDISILTIDSLEDPENDVTSEIDGENDDAEDQPVRDLGSTAPMPYDDLVKLRDESSFNIHTVSAELTQLLEVSILLLSEPTPSGTEEPPIAISAFSVGPSEIKASVRATDIRVTLGVKDALIEDSSTILSSAASRISHLVANGQTRWEQAIRARSTNWTLLPQLPSPNALRRMEDSVAKDFLLSYALDDSPPTFKRRSLVSFAASTSSTHEAGLVFPTHPRRRLRVSVGKSGSDILASSIIDLTTAASSFDNDPLNERLLQAQRELVEEEIFALLIQEAATFPSAAAFVTPRRIIIEVAAGTDVIFELVPADYMAETSEPTPDAPEALLCNLTLHILLLLILRVHRARRILAMARSGYERHRFLRVDDLAFRPGITTFASTPGSATASQAWPQRPGSSSAAASPQTPPILAPIISLFHYQAFLQTLHSSLQTIASQLRLSGVPCDVLFTPVGESAAEVVRMLERADETSVLNWQGIGMGANVAGNVASSSGGKDFVGLELSGESVLWVDNCQALRMTFSSPTFLTLHLPHATLNVTSIPAVNTFLASEIRARLLEKLAEDGETRFGGRWALDRLDSTCSASWEDRSIHMTFSIDFDSGLKLTVVAVIQIGIPSGSNSRQESRYTPLGLPAAGGKDQAPHEKLSEWFRRTVKSALKKS